MLTFLKKSITGRNASVEFDRNNLVKDEFLKKQLKEELASAIKKLQRDHISSEHEIDRNDEDALYICTLIEAIFMHGYQDRKSIIRSSFQNASIEEIQHVSFWDVLQEITHKDVISQISNLSVTSRIGMCRAWVRIALNDCLIESYMDAVRRNKDNIRMYYSQNAFLIDEEALPIAIDLLQGLMEFQFHLNYNSSKLDEWSMDSLFFAGIAAGKRSATPRSSVVSNHRLHMQPHTSGFPTTETRLKASSFASSQVSDTDSDVIQFNDTPISTTTADSEALARNSPVTAKSDSPPKEIQQPQQQTVSPLVSEKPASLSQPVSNRISLADGAWGGWSSAFETGKTPEEAQSGQSESIEAEAANPIEELSFDTLLQNYGTPGPLKLRELEACTTTNDADFHPQNEEGPISPSEDENVHEMNYEVVPSSSSLNTQHTDERTQFLLDHITVIGLERGLDKQSFQCNGCGRPIGLIYGAYRVCYYDGGYYCLECHEDDEHVIPAKVVHNWDFKPYKVSKLTKMFLMKIEEEPLFHVDEINPTLYNAVPELNHIKMLRIQLQHLKGFILTCKNDVAEDFRRRLWPREYMCDDIHQYSALDLVQVHTGQLFNHLKKILSQFSKHVYKCSLCSQKGFICEICNDQKIIYPFDIGKTFQCHRCLSLYHKKCKQDRRCVKCIRLQFRKKNEEKTIEWF